MKRPSMNAATIEYVRSHPGCYSDEIAKALQKQFPKAKKKTLQSLASGLKFKGRLYVGPGTGYFVSNISLRESFERGRIAERREWAKASQALLDALMRAKDDDYPAWPEVHAIVALIAGHNE